MTSQDFAEEAYALDDAHITWHDDHYYDAPDHANWMGEAGRQLYGHARDARSPSGYKAYGRGASGYRPQSNYGRGYGKGKPSSAYAPPRRDPAGLPTKGQGRGFGKGKSSLKGRGRGFGKSRSSRGPCIRCGHAHDVSECNSRCWQPPCLGNWEPGYHDERCQHARNRAAGQYTFHLSEEAAAYDDHTYGFSDQADLSLIHI